MSRTTAETPIFLYSILGDQLFHLSCTGYMAISSKTIYRELVDRCWFNGIEWGWTGSGAWGFWWWSTVHSFLLALVMLLKDLKVGCPPLGFRPANFVGLSLETRSVGWFNVVRCEPYVWNILTDSFSFVEGGSFKHPRRIYNVVPGDFTHSGKLDILVMSQSQRNNQLDLTLYPALVGDGFGEFIHPLGKNDHSNNSKTLTTP